MYKVILILDKLFFLKYEEVAKLNASPPSAPRIRWFFWDLRLMLFDTPKDTVFAEIWVFSNIFVVFLKYLKTKILGFLNWAANWTKTVNFACVSFEVILNILKDFSNAVFALLETTSVQKISARLNNILGRKGPKKPKKEPFHGCWISTKNFENF